MFFLTHLLSGNCTPQIQHWIFDPWNENLQTDAGLIFDVIKGLPTSTQLSGAGLDWLTQNNADIHKIGHAYPDIIWNNYSHPSS